jgi:hypothetical protein
MVNASFYLLKLQTFVSNKMAKSYFKNKLVQFLYFKTTTELFRLLIINQVNNIRMEKVKM